MTWLVAAHRGPTVAMVTIATALAGLIGAPLGLTFLAVLAGQLSVGWQNDLVDAERDAAVGRIAKPLVAGSISRTALRRAFFVAAVLVLPLSLLAFGVAGGVAHTAAVISAWSYNLGLKRTLFSFVPYVVSFTLFPATIYLGANRQPPLWILIVGAIAGIVIHLLNAWPDVDDDLAVEVRGLPQRLVAFARDSSTTSSRSSQRWIARWLRGRT